MTNGLCFHSAVYVSQQNVMDKVSHFFSSS